MRVYRRLEATVKEPDGRAGGIGRTARLLVAALAVALSAAGCAERTAPVTRQELFSLSVGPLEDQVHISPGYEQAGVWLSLHDGLFHVVNAPVRKVMRFSSFGDLLLLLYDPRLNPTPVGLAEAGTDTVTTRLARSLPLGPLGRVAVDSQGTIYVQERLASGDWQTEDGITRSHVVRRFDRTGADLGYLGREGVGGSPFGRVHRLLVTERDEPFVVTRDADSWQAFWFDSEGMLRFRRRLSVRDLRSADDVPPTVEIESVLADGRGPPHLLVETVTLPGGQADLWRVTGDEDPERAFAAPHAPHAPFRLVGSAGGRLFFASHGGGESVSAGGRRVPLTITDAEGRPLAQVELSLQDPALQFSELQVATDGVLYGARIGPERVDFFWWRTDLLMQRR